MPALNFNEMAKADDESKLPAPSGRYAMVIDKAEWKISKNSGAHMIQLILRVDEGPYKGKPVWNYLVMDPNNTGAISMARNFLNTVGLDFSDFEGKTDQQQIDLLLGKRFEAELNVDEYNGRKSNKLKRLIRGLGGKTGSGFTPPPASTPQASGPTSPKNPLAI